MNRNELYGKLKANFGFMPTHGQDLVLYHLAAFLLSEKPMPAYILRGYAGTGKTSLVSALVRTLPQIGIKYVLLAPTGRAAKVLSLYTKQSAYTIHHKIYHFKNQDDFQRVIIADNKSKNTLFVVDEASMIGDDRYNQSLLNDLIEYVFQDKSNKLLLIGDNAQLPPVGTNESPALNINYLKSAYDLTIASYELTEVKRQSLESGILANATGIRELLSENTSLFDTRILNTEFGNVKNIQAEDFQELAYNCFSEEEKNNSVIICKSNKRANLYNQSIRNHILNADGMISTGDRLMILKNNYFWKDDQGAFEFIANGDVVEIRKIKHFEEMYEFSFADVELSLVDYENEPTIEAKIILNTLNSEFPTLTLEEYEKLRNNVLDDYPDTVSKAEQTKILRNDPWLNALQVKFAYALTCHKTQGGQWKNVFIDSTFNLKDELEREDLRWLYTACTRAIDNLYLIDFKEEMFEG